MASEAFSQSRGVVRRAARLSCLLAMISSACTAVASITSDEMLVIESASQASSAGFKIAFIDEDPRFLSVLVCHERAMNSGESALFKVEVIAPTGEVLFYAEAPSRRVDAFWQRYLFTLQRDLFQFSRLMLTYEKDGNPPMTWSKIRADEAGGKDYRGYEFHLGFIPDSRNLRSSPSNVLLLKCPEI